MTMADGQMTLFDIPPSTTEASKKHPRSAPSTRSHEGRGLSSRRLRQRKSPLREQAFEVFAETLFPTRCAICDAPGTPLCPECTRRLPYIDTLLACPRCGAPFGRIQCTECNSVLLAPFGYQEPPWDEAASAVILTDEARRVVTTYKDQGERALARPIAAIMTRLVPPSWLAAKPAIAFVPATVAARRRRGFDHAELLARELSWALEADLAPLLSPPRRLDQRKLSRTARIQNMRESFSVLPGATAPRTVIIVDDVCTTGSTLFAATEALRKGGAETIYALTFARA